MCPFLEKDKYQEQVKAILESAKWERLSGTILLIPPENDPRPQHLKTTRQSHCLQVWRIAHLIVGKAQNTKEIVEEGIVQVASLCHDLAHLPYGHWAEHKMPGIHEEIYNLIIDDKDDGNDRDKKDVLRSKITFDHDKNGPEWYSRVMDNENLTPCPSVQAAIREHRRPYERKSCLESFIVAMADDIATLLSNFEDGLNLPQIAPRYMGIYPTHEAMWLIIGLGGHNSIYEWEKEIVSWIDDRVFKNKSWLVNKTKDESWFYICESHRNVMDGLRQLDRFHEKSPHIEARNLNLFKRMMAFWSQCHKRGLEEKDALNELLSMKEWDFAEFG